MIDHLKSCHCDKTDREKCRIFEKQSKNSTCLEQWTHITIMVSLHRRTFRYKLFKMESHIQYVDNLFCPIQEAATTVIHKDGRSLIKSFPLSNDTLPWRIYIMASDIGNICDILKTTVLSLQIDEFTMLGNEALLLAYVCLIQEDILAEEMLFARPLMTDTNGESILQSWRISSKKKKSPCVLLLHVPPKASWLYCILKKCYT